MSYINDLDKEKLANFNAILTLSHDLTTKVSSARRGLYRHQVYRTAVTFDFGKK